MSLVAARDVKPEPPNEPQAVGEVPLAREYAALTAAPHAYPNDDGSGCSHTQTAGVVAVGELKEGQDLGGGSGISPSPPSTSAMAYCKKESDGASSSESQWAYSSSDEGPGRQKRMRTEVAVDVRGSVAGAGRQVANIWARKLRGSSDRACKIRSSTATSSTLERCAPGSADYTVEPGCFAYAKMTGSPWWPGVVYNTPSEVPQDVKRNLLAFSTVTVDDDELLVFFLGTYNLAVVHKSMIRDVVDVDPSAMLKACKGPNQRRLFRKAMRDMEEMEAEGEQEDGEEDENYQQDKQGQQDREQKHGVGTQGYGTQAKKTSGHRRAVKASKTATAQERGAGKKLRISRPAYAKRDNDTWWPAIIYDSMSDVPKGHKAKGATHQSLALAADECIVRFVGESGCFAIAENRTRDVQSIDEMELLQSCRSKAERARLAHTMAVMEELTTGQEGDRESESI